MLKVWVRIISVLEIIGGLVGIGLVMRKLLALPFDAFFIIPTLISMGIYVLSLVAGVALWRGSSFGRKVSIIVQAIQLPKIVSPWLTFTFSFGFDLWIHILVAYGLVTPGVETRVLPSYMLKTTSLHAPLSLGVSVTAGIFLALLLRHKPAKN